MGLAHMLLALAWLIAVSAMWLWMLSRPQKHMLKTVLLTAICFGILFFGADRWMVWQKAEQVRTNAQPQPTPASTSTSESDSITLLPPKQEHRYRWVPLQHVSPDLGVSLPQGSGIPKFRLKNSSDELVSQIQLIWKILDSTPIKAAFLSSEHYRRYKAEIDGANYWLRDEKGNGTGTPAADEESVMIPFVRPTTATEDELEIMMPLSIAYSYMLRITGTLARPAKEAKPITSAGPTLEVIMIYRHSGKDYRRRFVVESSVRVISDTTTDPMFGEQYVEPQYWSSDNFRAVVTFSTSTKE